MNKLFIVFLLMLGTSLLAQGVWSPLNNSQQDKENSVANIRGSINAFSQTNNEQKISTVKELNTPQGAVFDITQEDDGFDGNDIIKVMIEVEKMAVSIDKITNNFPRENRTYDCKRDTYNTEYCPDALAEADQYWSYDSGYSTAHTGSYSYDCSYYGSSTSYQGQTNGTTFVSVFWPSWCSTGYLSNGWAQAASGQPVCTTVRTWTTCNGSDGRTYPFGYTFNCGRNVVSVCPSGWTPTTERGSPECKITTTTYIPRTCSGSYTYYNYHCKNETNDQQENWQMIGTTGGNCGHRSSSPCNSSTPPANNCKRKEFKCKTDANKKPVWIGGKWQCSPFDCDTNGECGNAMCINGESNPEGTNYDPSPLVGVDTSNICNDTICDLVKFENIGRCSSESKCPTAFGVYEVDGNCWKDECPAGSHEKDIGGGETICVTLGCPKGTVENGDKCEKKD